MDYEDNNSDEENKSEYDENGRKKIVLRELTVLEQQMHVKAKEKHMQNITKPQVVQGKTFQGDSFLSKPDKIIFKDFDVGEPYVQTIYLTNVSLTFNSFKLKPLKESIRDFFEIMYKPPGRISAGMSCPITFRFTAQTIDDIDDVFPILTETGPVNIPLICTSKKAICECVNPVIDFDKVIYGEDSTKTLVLVNKGALQTEVTIKSAKGLDILTKTETASQVGSVQKQQQDDSQQNDKDIYSQNLQQSLSQLKFSKVYKIKGYSELHIPIKYVPNQIGNMNLPLMLYFENYLHSPPINIIIKGECIEVPIYVEKPIYDFEICLLNHIYREKIVFHNRSQNAMKTQIVAPKETKQFFQFNPLLGYIQGKSKFEVWVKMNADKDLLTFCSKYLDKQTGFLDIPFKLIGADQVMPVPFTIRARMTINTVQITPGKINFGKLYEGTASRMALTCENLSELPQELLFYPLPKEISVEMDLIPIKLLPKEKFQTNLIYRSTKIPGVDSRKDEGYLKCKIITGTIATKDIRIPYSCDINKCPLEFSAMKIDIPATQVDEVFSTTLMIKNTTHKVMLFEFFLPKFEICGLKLSPMVQRIQPEESVEINLEYFSFFKRLTAFTLDELAQKYDNDPNYNFQLRMKMKKEQQDEEKKKQEEAANEDPKNKKAGAKEVKKEAPKKPEKLSKAQLQAQEEEQKRLEELERQREEEERQRKLQIEQNFNMEEELAKLGGKLLEFNKDHPNHNQQYTWLIPCYFKHTDMPDVSKFLTFIEINTVTVNKSLLLDKTVINFGEIAVGIREIRELLITNNSDQVASIHSELLPLFSGFNVINALRPIQPQKTRNIVVQFQPHEDKPFEETLKIKCKTTCVSAKLIGKGVRPEVKLIPENGLLNIGGVVLGEKAEKTFKVQNVSNFNIKFKVTSIAHGIYNKNGSKVFSFIPSEVQIEAHKEIEIKLIFQPDRISEQFFELVCIDVPNQKDEKKLFIWGSCYPRQCYVTHYKPYLSLPSANSLPQKIESPFDMLKISDEETIFSPKNTRIMLEFTKPKIKEINVFASNLSGEKEEEPVEDNNVNNNDETMQLRKLIIGNSKIYSDPKLEKPCNYEVIMPKDDKNNYFTCDNPKGTVAAGSETILLFRLKPPQMDQLISSIEALQGLGQWRELKAELKVSGGFLSPGQTDLLLFEVVLRAYINQI